MPTHNASSGENLSTFPDSMPSNSLTLPVAEEETIPGLTNQSWLEQTERYGVQVAVNQIMGPHTVLKDRARVAEYLLDMVIRIGDWTSEAVVYVVNEFMTGELSFSRALRLSLNSPIDRLIRASAPLTTVSLYNMPTRLSLSWDEGAVDEEDEPSTITGGEVLELFQRVGVKTSIEQLMEQHTTPQVTGLAGAELINMMGSIKEFADESVTYIWEHLMYGAPLWDEPKYQLDFQICYEEVIDPILNQHREIEAKKASYRQTIGVAWGDDWEDELDPEGLWLHYPSAGFLKVVATMATGGWQLGVIRTALEDGAN